MRWINILFLSIYIITLSREYIYSQEINYDLAITNLNVDRIENDKYTLAPGSGLFKNYDLLQDYSLDLSIFKSLNKSKVIELNILSFEYVKNDFYVQLNDPTSGRTSQYLRGEKHEAIAIKTGLGIGKEFHFNENFSLATILASFLGFEYNATIPYTYGGYDEMNYTIALSINPKIRISYQLFNRLRIGYQLNFIQLSSNYNIKLLDGLNLSNDLRKSQNINFQASIDDIFWGYQRIFISLNIKKKKSRRKRR